MVDGGVLYCDQHIVPRHNLLGVFGYSKTGNYRIAEDQNAGGSKSKHHARDRGGQRKICCTVE